MARIIEIERIALRKHWVITKSEIYRLQLAEEIQRLNSAASWVPSTMTLIKSSVSILRWVAPLAGLFGKRKRKNSLTGMVWGGWELFQRLKNWAAVPGASEPAKGACNHESFNH